MITSKSPTSWQELEEWTAQILEECGWEVRTKDSLESVRGRVAFDVIATEEREGRKYLTVIECKHWNNRVPQTVVHAFQTTVQGVGANSGYIVSKIGFQSGAYEAAEKTNIKLVTWDEFQQEFLEQWYSNHLTICAFCWYRALYELIGPSPQILLLEDYFSETELLRARYLNTHTMGLFHLLGDLSEIALGAMQNFQEVKVQLPITRAALHFQYKDLPNHFYWQTGYRELMKAIDEHALMLLLQFTALKGIGMTRKMISGGSAEYPPRRKNVR